MHALYLGKLGNVIHNKKTESNVVSGFLLNLSNSNIGLTKDSSSTSSVLDDFNITKNISELLSPACGMTEEEKETYLARIQAKLKNGKKLTPEEMRFLQAEHPDLYMQAARVQAMRDGLESRLKVCHSKQEAQTMYANALDSVSDEDPMKEYIVAAYQDVMKEFEKSEEYKDLPD